MIPPGMPTASVRQIICQFYRQQSMKQKSLSLQPHRPKPIKLVPFTLLPKLRLTSLPSTSHQTTALPFISGKAKTSPSEGHFDRQERVKTEQMQQKQEESTSFRLISRFVYNHLQKKINFQAQTRTNYQDSPVSEANSHTPDSEGQLRQEIFNQDYYRGESYISNPIKEASNSQILKFKNKLYIRAKAMHRLAQESKPQRNRNRYANIDSYFDLSCLDSCERRGR